MNDAPPEIVMDAMSDEDLQSLVNDLSRGDEGAIRRAFHAFEPYLRMVVRRRLSSPLRATMDSEDIIQSIWADLLPGFRRAGWKFLDATHLRSFLTRVTRNRLIDRQRRHAQALELERSVANGDLRGLPVRGSERPSQLAQASDLWNQMLESCPASHRAVLQLRREGLSSAEIAARVGLHEGSVRRILCDLARRLGLQIKAGSNAGGQVTEQRP